MPKRPCRSLRRAERARSERRSARPEKPRTPSEGSDCPKNRNALSYAAVKTWHTFYMKRSLFRFDEPYERFELLETEQAARRAPFFDAPKDDAIPTRLDRVKERLSDLFCAETNPDLILRPFRIGRRCRALAAFLNGMADGKRIEEFLIKPAQQVVFEQPLSRTADELVETVFPLEETDKTRAFSEAVRAIVEGRTALFLAGSDECLLFDTRGFVSRAVGEPENEPVVLGPHEAFTEHLRNNVTLLRRIVKLPHFTARFLPAGGQNGTQLALCYLAGVTNEALLAEVERRLSKIDTTALLSIGTIEQRIEDNPLVPLPQTLKTERPDRVGAAIMDGKVAILLEGSPIALVLPATLGMLFASAEDAAVRRPVGTLLRLVRMAGTVLSVWMPAYFLALVQHHAGQLSGEVLSVVLSSHVMVFLPLPAEMIFLLLVFQLVREAGVRVPGVVGHAIGIIGGLLLGQAAVAAHLVSTVVLIIVALSGLGNFTIPDYSTQLCIAYYRVALCVAATFSGFLGIGVVTLLSIALLSSLKSFGVPMLAPLAPKTRTVRPFLFRGRVQNRSGAQDPFNPEVRP